VNPERQITFRGLAVKTVLVHTVTYFLMGLLAVNVLGYRSTFVESITGVYMRAVSDPN
jgi:hypothetical protein